MKNEHPFADKLAELAGPVLRPLRSMRFANILLALVALLCGLSSLLPQGRGLPFYAENYPKAYLLIYHSHFYDVFKSWYFLVLMALLCLSLLACTVRMFVRAFRSVRDEEELAAALPNAEKLEPGELETLRRWAASVRCREKKVGDVLLFRKNKLGYWGTALLHLSILLVVIAGVYALSLPKVTDLECRPGESVFLEDGTEIEVESFRLTDEAGQLDYASVIRVTLPDGRRSASQEIKVNYPMTFGSCKVFQWSYGVCGSVLIRDTATGAEQRLDLEDSGFITPDRMSGVEYNGVFQAETGEDGEERRVLYRLCVVSNGRVMPEMELPAGESVTVGGYEYCFQDPYYPGLRVKQTAGPYVNSCLEGAFVLMLLGLFLCFYHRPVLIKADETGYTVAGPRPEQMRLELRRLLQKEGGEKK